MKVKTNLFSIERNSVFFSVALTDLAQPCLYSILKLSGAKYFYMEFSGQLPNQKNNWGLEFKSSSILSDGESPLLVDWGVGGYVNFNS